jgi:flagellar basal-body rod protein FlgB
MAADTIGGVSLTLAQQSLDALWLRQQTIGDNIANVDTPGYKRKMVAFEDLLKQAASGARDGNTLAQRLDSVSPQVAEDQSTALREDGNNVDIDAESIELARAVIQYRYMSRIASSEISRLKYAITEGRG